MNTPIEPEFDPQQDNNATDERLQTIWRRTWPILAGMAGALSIATIGYLLGASNSGPQTPAPASGATASQAMASLLPASAAAASQAAASGPMFQGAFTAPGALQTLFGELVKRGTESYARWPQARLPAGDAFNNYRGRPLRVVELANFPLNEENETRRLFLFQSTPDTADFTAAHADGAVIGAAVFRPAGDGWQLVRETRAITVAGQYGNAPNGKPVMLSANHWGLLFEDGSTNQGYTNRYAFLLDQNEQGFIDPKLQFDLGGDNAGQCDNADTALPPCYQYQGSVQFKPTAGSERYLIEHTLRGTRFNTDRTALESFVETHGYVYRAGRYVEDPARHVLKLKPLPPRAAPVDAPPATDSPPAASEAQ